MGRLLQIGAEDGARFKLAFGVAHQHPTDGQGRQAAAVPDGGAGGDFDLTVRLAIPVGKRQPPPDSAGIGEDFLELRRARELARYVAHNITGFMLSTGLC